MFMTCSIKGSVGSARLGSVVECPVDGCITILMNDLPQGKLEVFPSHIVTRFPDGWIRLTCGTAKEIKSIVKRLKAASMLK